MGDRYKRSTNAVVPVAAALGMVLVLALCTGCGLLDRPWRDRMLDSSYAEASSVPTPARHRATASALASWLAESRGGTGRVTGIATWSGGYGSHRRVIPHGIETNFVGEITAPALKAPVRFYGSILEGPPNAEVGIAIDGVEFTSQNLATSSPSDRQKAKRLVASLVAASGLAHSYDTARSVSNAQFSDFQVVAILAPLSSETSEGLAVIDFADGLLPGDCTVSAKRY